MNFQTFYYFLINHINIVRQNKNNDRNVKLVDKNIEKKKQGHRGGRIPTTSHRHTTADLTRKR